MRYSRKVTISSLSASIIALDQAVKFVLERNFPETVQYNPHLGLGISFISGFDFYLSIIAVAVLAYLMIKNFKSEYAIALAMILAGGVSNLIDRFIRPGVADYLTLWFIPNFNTADIFISAGVILILVRSFLLERSTLDRSR